MKTRFWVTALLFVLLACGGITALVLDRDGDTGDSMIRDLRAKSPVPASADKVAHVPADFAR